MRKVAVVQARMGSTRLPGKTLLPAAGKPLLQLLLERLQRASHVDHIVVATTDRPEDEVLEPLCKKMGVGCFRGSSDDVLGRVAQAVEAAEGDVHIEVHGDGPLLDPAVVDQIVGFYSVHQYDMVTNSLKTTYPPGLEVWVYSNHALQEAARLAKDPLYREHVTLYIETHPELYTVWNIEAPPELRYPDMYLEVDTAEDYELIRTVYEALYPTNPGFTTQDVLVFLRDHPEVASANQLVPRRWKQLHSQASEIGE